MNIIKQVACSALVAVCMAAGVWNSCYTYTIPAKAQHVTLSVKEVKQLLETLGECLVLTHNTKSKRGFQLPGSCCNNPNDLLLEGISGCIQMVISTLEEQDAQFVSQLEAFESTFDAITTVECETLNDFIEDVVSVGFNLNETISLQDAALCSKLMLMSSFLDIAQNAATQLTEDIEESVGIMLDEFDTLNLNGLINDANELIKIALSMLEAA